MASSTSDQDAIEEFLPFSGLDQSDVVHVLSGPRISSTKDNPRKFFGPVTIRNYLAGNAKKHLRLSRTMGAPESGVFLKLPVELQFQVLEHLHPLDLYHFSLVSKSFRKLILHPKLLGVWRTAFVRHPDLPPPPPRVKESDWAFMIYGPGICGVCGKHGALTDFSFLKRFCELCLKDYCIPIHSFRDESNHTIPPSHDIWTLIPKSYRFNGVRYTTYITERFSKADFAPMWKKLTLIRILATNGVPLVSRLYEEYKTELKDCVQRQYNSATYANNWAVDVFRQLSDDYDNLASRLTDKCKIRLRGLGHDTQDIAAVSGSIRSEVREDARYHLTRRTFRKIRPRIEFSIKQVKGSRIEMERRTLLKGIYRDYLKARPPDDWQYLPHVEARHILEIEAFKEFLGPPFDERGDISPGFVAGFFPDCIDKWVKAQQENIAGILPAAEETFEAKVQRLELASSVFTCRNCNDTSHSGRALVGWKSICRHMRFSANGHPEICQKYEVNRHVVAAATSLVSCVGLDPLTATVDDMNHRNDRFMCGNCMPEADQRGHRFMRVYTWLECLEHTVDVVNLYTEAIDAMHATPAWLLLSPGATRFVREHEKPYPRPLHHIWRCNHCAQHFENQASQVDVVDHVKRVHCIGNPVIGVDVVADQRQNIRKRRPFRLYRDPAFEHRCKHCPELPIYKLWEKDALMEHLKKKHHINEPVENVDWETAVMIAASAALVPAPTMTDNV